MTSEELISKLTQQLREALRQGVSLEELYRVAAEAAESVQTDPDIQATMELPGSIQAETRSYLGTDAEETLDFDRSLTGTTKAGASVGLPDYEILEEIARGGMGIVYRARQISLSRVVALKMILAGQLASDEQVQRFHSEAEAAAKLDHPGIVPIHEVGERNGQHFFSMGFVEGQSLAERLNEGPLPTREAATVLRKIADAVAYAHSQGLLHRDLKCGNVLLDANGEPRVTDFGLAKHIEGDSNLTVTGQIMGTPSYMPPEQAQGRTVNERSDVYSLGAILYAVLTGRPPHQAANPVDTIRSVIEREPAPPRQLDRSIPRDLETICLKALAKEPVRRYGSAAEFSQDLQRFLSNEPIAARRVGRAEKAWLWCRRNPKVALLGSAAAIVLLVLGAVAYEWRNRSRAEALIDGLIGAEPSRVMDFARELDNYRHWALADIAELASRESGNSADLSQLHARLALVQYDDDLAPVLLETLLNLPDNQVAYIPPLREALSPYGGKFVDELQKKLRNPTLDDGVRFRAGLALAGFNADRKSWSEDDLEFMANQLVASSPFNQPPLLELLQELGQFLVDPLKDVFVDSGRPENEQFAAASWLAKFATGNTQRIATWLTKATPVQYEILYPEFTDPSDAALAELKSLVSEQPGEGLTQAERIDLGKRRAGAAITLARRGKREAIFDVFRVREDPESLTQFVHRCRARGVTRTQLLELLDIANKQRQAADKQQRKVEERPLFAILLALGEFPLSEITEEERNSLIEKLTHWHQQDPSSAIHGATGWLLRHWGREEVADSVDPAFIFDHVPDLDEIGDREWFMLEVDAAERNGESAVGGDGKISFTFVLFPPGEFMMGSPSDEENYETGEKLHRVRLTRPLAVCDREIAWSQLRPFNHDSFRQSVVRNQPGKPVSDEYPASIVNWFEAVQYCQWLSLRANLDSNDQCYERIEIPQSSPPGIVRLPDTTQWPLKTDWRDRRGFRLLTDAEWEYVCRSGTRTMYSFGSDIELFDRYGWFEENTDGWSHKSGELRPNLRGLLDVHGNVFEWCYDWYKFRLNDVAEDPTGPSEGSGRLSRGGSWNSSPRHCRAAPQRGASVAPDL